MLEVDALMRGVGWGGLFMACSNAAIYAAGGGAVDRLWEWLLVEAVLVLVIVARPVLVMAGALKEDLFDTREALRCNLVGRLMGVVLGVVTAAWAWALTQ